MLPRHKLNPIVFSYAIAMENFAGEGQTCKEIKT
jgi:hypothetical protein